MTSVDALQILNQFASLQGHLVRKFLHLYDPKDRERFRDVPNGTLSVNGRTWSHQRHGAGVTFTDSNNTRVNAHVGMTEHPEGIDSGRILEYLESLDITTVSFDNRDYSATIHDINNLINDMTQRGLLRTVTTQGRFPHQMFKLTHVSNIQRDGGNIPVS
ncbi:uncharacterized protein SOCE26_070200 [Sorangium cellulosum]|uniref:DUF6896 domain-containing protein n=1 Tax=Sorangium cellulosum TaxID=56 RepID=A0A2L0F1W0_SORCE|nr:uncharacterized protein SOCE26_070200 [Sorangium cellulosum]